MSTTTSTGGTTGAPAAIGTPRDLQTFHALLAPRTAVTVVPRPAPLGDRTGGGLRPRGGVTDANGDVRGRVDQVGVRGSVRGAVPAPLFLRSCGTPVPGSARHPAT